MTQPATFVHLRFASPGTRATVFRAFSLAVALLLALPAAALDVGEAIWNFDGHVVPERFNLLSVRIGNPSQTPFEGELRLSPYNGFDAGVGAAYVQPCYVSPFGSRWVQFQVYITDESRWRLSWGGRQGESLVLDAPRIGPPARVLLVDADALRAVRASFPRFPDHLFPPSVTALDNLHSVLLDYAPRWEAPRRAAFADWLRGGGSVHLLADAAGRFPVFRDELAVLNTTADSSRVGAGWVYRHRQTAAEIDEAWLTRQGLRAPWLLDNTTNIVIYQMSGSLLPALGQLAKPEHCWWLIGLLALLYVVAVGPGVFMLARGRRDYRIALLALGGCVLCFSGLFSYVGRRGQGEAGQVNTIAYARALGEGQYLVTQWIDLFVTHGDYYALTHAGSHNLYAVPQDAEQVNGAVLGGREGAFRVDIPMFSQRSFLHQGKLEGPRCDVRAAEWPAGADLRSGKLVVGDGFPASPLVIWATWQDQVWTLQRRDNLLVPEGEGVTFDSFFSREKVNAGEMYYGYGRVTPGRDSSQTLEALSRRKAPAVLAWGLGTTKILRHGVSDPREHDRLRVFVLAAGPAGFRLRGTPRTGAETGYVLYAFELTPPPGKKEER